MLRKLENRCKVQHCVGGMNVWLGWGGLSVAVGLAYFLTAQLGLALLTSAERVAVFWPASGIAVGILIALGGSARGPVAAGVIAATLAANLMSDRNVWSASSFALCNAAEALLAMWLIERCFGRTFSLDSLRRVLGLFASAAVATATAAVGASGAMRLFGPSTAAFFDVWEVWFASDALGIITIAPLLIGVAAAVREAPSWRELLEGTIAVAIVTAAIGILLAILSGPWSLVGPSALLFPLLLWLAYRCRPVFAAAAVFTIAAAIVWTTTYEFGSYGDPAHPTAIRIAAAQIAMLGTTLAALALAALFAERRRSEAALGESDARLRSILDAANVIAWDVDLTRDAVHAAGPVTRLLHRSEGSVPRDFAAMIETIHPEDRERVMSQFWTAVSTGATYRLEFRLNCERSCWVTAEGSIYRDAGGRPVRVRGITHDITQRKLAEMALAEREAQLGLAGKAARVGSFAVDYATERIQTSPGYAAIHGLAEGTEEYPRAEWRARVHPDDLARVDVLRRQAFADLGREHHMEYRIVGDDGETRWIESRGLVSYDGNKRPTRLIGVHIDITERKRVQIALEESEARFRATFENAAVGVALVGTEGSILRANNSFARMLGYSGEELTSRTFQDLTHPDDLATNLSARNKALVGEAESYCIEKRYIRKDGGIVWASLTVGCVRKTDGGVAYFISVIQDITDRKLAEQTLAERNIQLGLAAKAGLVGAYAYDVETAIMQISDGYAAIHGFPEGTSEIRRSECLAGVHPDDMKRLAHLHDDAFRASGQEYSLEYRIVRPGGEVRWVEARGSVSYNDRGRPQRVVGVNIDITERKRVEQQQGKLVAELDHRVKNVLATVQAVAAQTMRASSSMEHFVAAFDGRIRSMGSTHELLSRRRWTDIPLTELVKRELAPYTARNNTEINGPDVMLSAEAAQSMAMVLHELVTNAAKYGALSTRDGRACVRWHLLQDGDTDAGLCFEWHETGGPTVQASMRPGYGIEIIRGLVPHELGGKVDLAFASDGVRCRLDVPLSQLCQ